MVIIVASLRAGKIMRTKKQELPLDTIIEVVAFKGDKVKITKMTFGTALFIDKSKGWVYKNYQLGFCTMKEES